MAQKSKDAYSEDVFAIHKYYMDIINCMPNIVYWVDVNCKLKGCNLNFVKWLGLKRMNDFVGTPYEQMQKFSSLKKERIAQFRLDDMAVLFNGEATYDVEESPVYGKEDSVTYFFSNRVPLLDKDKHVIGLVVILMNADEHKKTVDKAPQLSQATVAQDPNYRPNVLMVEDNFIAQKVEEALLTALNCQVDIAQSGDEAIALFAPGKYDIVFMDIGLQDTSGYMVAKKIRQMEKGSQDRVPIIALTSYQAEVVKKDVSDYFMEGVVTKPLTSQQATQIIKRYVFHESTEVDGLKKV